MQATPDTLKVQEYLFLPMQGNHEAFIEGLDALLFHIGMMYKR